MSGTRCNVEGCSRPYYGKGYCSLHWERNYLHGSPDALLRPWRTTLSELLEFHVKPEGSCSIWTGALDKAGYATTTRAGKRRKVHRLVYEAAHGPIPAGQDIDHKCHNPACVALDHLQAVSRKENAENRKGAMRGTMSGVRGVSWSKSHRKWHVQVGHNGKNHHGGFFDLLDEAEAAAKKLRLELHTNNLRDRIG